MIIERTPTRTLTLVVRMLLDLEVVSANLWGDELAVWDLSARQVCLASAIASTHHRKNHHRKNPTLRTVGVAMALTSQQVVLATALRVYFCNAANATVLEK